MKNINIKLVMNLIFRQFWGFKIWLNAFDWSICRTIHYHNSLDGLGLNVNIWYDKNIKKLHHFIINLVFEIVNIYAIEKTLEIFWRVVWREEMRDNVQLYSSQEVGLYLLERERDETSLFQIVHKLYNNIHI